MRFALVQPEEALEEAAGRIAGFISGLKGPPAEGVRQC